MFDVISEVGLEEFLLVFMFLYLVLKGLMFRGSRILLILLLLLPLFLLLCFLLLFLKDSLLIRQLLLKSPISFLIVSVV